MVEPAPDFAAPSNSLLNMKKPAPMADILAQISHDPRVVKIRAALGADGAVCLVGGTVRDALLGSSHADLDIATALDPDTVRIRLESAGIHVIPTGLKHQTVTAVPIPETSAVEITTFRGPGMNPAGGLVASSSIEEDLCYRDFTINALAYDLARGAIIDPIGGRKDLAAKIVRAVGSPAERFTEDPLRCLRMIRFAAALGFDIDPPTYQAARGFTRQAAAVSIERIREEFSRILVSPRAESGIRQLYDLGLLAVFLPEIAGFYGFEQNRFHRADLFNHTLAVVSGTGPELGLRLSALFHDVGKPPTLSVDENGDRHFYLHEDVGAKMTREILLRLKYPGDLIDEVATLVRTHMRPLDAGAGGLRRLLRDTGDLFPQWRELKEADASACKIEPETLRAQFEKFDLNMAEVLKGPKVSPLKSLAIDGNELMALGVPFGPAVGETLRALHERVLDDPQLNEKETLSRLAQEMLKTIS